ncbi:hypothetical protein [Pseudactinotalea sp. Z1732]|uniref:hypothetical protein n=1 Tax=Micrococcales TaxID=85006 RepID=UPI003C7AE18A
MDETPGGLRMRRPSWRDPRLGIGVLLVAASVALGSWVVTQAGATVPAYTAREVLVPGEPITMDDLEVVQVQMSGLMQTYLTPEEDVPADAVVLRTVGAGELVPAAAIGSAVQLDLRPVTIPTDASAATSLARGSRVDVWVARPDPQGSIGAVLPPVQLLPDVQVAEVLEDTALFAGANQVHVQVLIAEADLADVLEALSSGAEVILVPGPGA